MNFNDLSHLSNQFNALQPCGAPSAPPAPPAAVPYTVREPNDQVQVLTGLPQGGQTSDALVSASEGQNLCD